MKHTAIVMSALLCLCASAALAQTKAPEPAKPVDAASFFAGRWYEIGRTPKSFNRDCVAGYTDYQGAAASLSEHDGCHDKTPDGKEETIAGPVKILNPGMNTKFNIAYHVAFIPIHVENWVLDHDAGWAILGTPDMSEVHLYTREAHPAPALVEKLTKEVKDMGYAGELQFPAQSKP